MLFLERPNPYDSGATGELNIEALGWSHGRQSSWGDRKRWKLDDRLPQLMRELETQAAEAEERRLAKEREEAERQRQWEAAMDRAKLRLIEDHRTDVMRARVRGAIERSDRCTSGPPDAARIQNHPGWQRARSFLFWATEVRVCVSDLPVPTERPVAEVSAAVREVIHASPWLSRRLV